MTIRDLNERPDLDLVNDSQNVEEIRESIGERARKFDNYIVKVENGEYSEVYGFNGGVPFLDREVTRIK